MGTHRTAYAVILLAAMAPGTVTLSAQGAPPKVGIDHVILSTRVLSAGMAEFARLTGVTPVVGGQHPGRGTQNALVSLGDGQYLELLAPIVDSAPAGPLRFDGWAVHTDQIDALRAFLVARGLPVSEVSPGSRRQPSGQVLEWKTVGVPDSLYGIAPFVIQWSTAAVHPSKSSPGGCTLARVTLTDAPPYRTLELLQAIGLQVNLEKGDKPRMALRLTCPRGIVDFSS